MTHSANVFTSYAVKNLAELQQMIDAIRAEVEAAEGRKVADSDIYLQTDQFNEVTATVENCRLTDGSNVYNVIF